MTREEGRRLADEVGLKKLSDKQLDEFIAGVLTTRATAAKLPKDLHWGEEIAVAFRLKPGQRTK